MTTDDRDDPGRPGSTRPSPAPGALVCPAPGPVVRAEIEERRSRFIALVHRVGEVDAAREAVASARAEFPDARHHCSAWIIDVPGAQPLQHSSDDGEPSGTAGRPMLQVLAGAGLSDVAGVVVRYFGGTLLGTGGLVRAYSDAVTAALARTPLVVREALASRVVDLEHGHAGKVEAELRGAGADVTDARYRAAGVSLTVASRDPGAVESMIGALTAGRARVRPGPAVYVESPWRP